MHLARRSMREDKYLVSLDELELLHNLVGFGDEHL